MKRFRIQLLIAGAVFICGLSLMGLIYIMFSKPDVYNSPGIVTTSSVPTTPHIQPLRPQSAYRGHTAVTPVRVSTPMHSTSPVAHPVLTIYTTSSAQTHSFGSGVGSMGIATTSSSSAARGINTSSVGVAMPMTNFTALASARTMAEPEAANAPAMARLASPYKAPPPPNPTDPLDPEHQLIEQPVGDALWPLILLAIGYILVLRTRKRQEA